MRANNGWADGFVGVGAILLLVTPNRLHKKPFRCRKGFYYCTWEEVRNGLHRENVCEPVDLVSLSNAYHFSSTTTMLNDDVALCAAQLGVKPGDDLVVRGEKLVVIPRYHPLYLINMFPTE